MNTQTSPNPQRMNITLRVRKISAECTASYGALAIFQPTAQPLNHEVAHLQLSIAGDVSP